LLSCELKAISGEELLGHRLLVLSVLQVKDVIDGDLCEQFSQLPAAKQKSISDELERSPGEILKKLEDIRNQVY